jgi:acyl-CoA thioester hydrolase
MSGAYEKAFEVRWNDVDLNGHLRNTGYQEFANHTRVAYFEDSGFPVSRLLKLGIGPILSSEQVEYRKETFLSQSLTVRVQAVGLSDDGARWRILQTFLHADGRIAATLTSSGGWLDLNARKLVTPPPEIKSLVEALRSADCETLE